MNRGWVSGALACLIVIAGAAVATAPFLTAQGSDGPSDAFPGSIIDLKPTYGALLVACGAAIAVLAPLAALLRNVAPSLVIAALAILSGLSLDTVPVIIDNSVIYREYSVFELRGTGPILAAAAALASLVLSIALTIAVAPRRRPTRVGRVPHTQRTGQF